MPDDKIPEEESDELDEDEELADELYPVLVTEEPERHVDVGHDGHKSLSEAETEGGNQSDLVNILKRLLPSFSDYEIDELDLLGRAIMVSNVSPDMFMEAMHLTVDSIVEAHAYDGIMNTKKPIDVMMVINVIFGIYSPALQGKVRVELVELAGSAKDNEELEKVSKGLGFG
jgi:hypothetical protein